MDPGYELTTEFVTIEGIAAAIRDDLGADMDEEFPARDDPAKAGLINRAFRATVRYLLERVIVRSDQLSTTLSAVFVRVAERRLKSVGLADQTTEPFVRARAAGHDDWPAFVILARRDVLASAIQDEGEVF
jgi:hypothetical protein